MGARAKASPKAFPETKWDWVGAAACQKCPDPTIFFPEDYCNLKTTEGLNEYRSWVGAVNSGFCSLCPVRAECQQHGLEKKEPAGIWGGLGIVERKDQQR